MLLKQNCPENVVAHCIRVSEKAVEMGESLVEAGVELDMGFLESAALLHDLGRCRTHGIRHGVAGAKILVCYPRYARVCESHIGGGIPASEAADLGLEEKDFIPETIEEKLICLADKLTREDEYVDIDGAEIIFKEKLGDGHPSVKRIRDLWDWYRSLLGK